MSTSSEKIVALDIGGVCVSLHPEKIYKKLGASILIKPPAEFMRCCNLFERGKISRDEWFSSFATLSGGKFQDQELWDIWNSMIGPSIPGMTDAVNSLISKDYRFVFFSNTSIIHMEQVSRMCDFAHLVTGGIFSYETGYMKPEQEIYEAFEKVYGIPYAYFDDRAENIDAALKRGWNAHVFKDAKTFLSTL